MLTEWDKQFERGASPAPPRGERHASAALLGALITRYTKGSQRRPTSAQFSLCVQVATVTQAALFKLLWPAFYFLLPTVTASSSFSRCLLLLFCSQPRVYLLLSLLASVSPCTAGTRNGRKWVLSATKWHSSPLLGKAEMEVVSVRRLVLKQEGRALVINKYGNVRD